METHRLVFASYSVLVSGWVSVIACQVFDWLFWPIAILVVFPFFAIVSLCLTTFLFFSTKDNVEKRKVRNTLVIQIALSVGTFILGIYYVNQMSIGLGFF